jgi:hypothetical protein
MIYFAKEQRHFKLKDIADKKGISRQHLYECARDLQSYNVINFKKTPMGSFLIEERQIELVIEYCLMKNIIKSPKQTIEIIKNSRLMEKEEEEDMSWAKDLNYAVWRRF